MDVLAPTARSLLAEARQLHVAVLATTGPHVTPELYTVQHDDLWFLTAADTLKTRVVRRDPRLAAVVRVGSRAAVLQGTASEYDVGDPSRLLEQAGDVRQALAALMSFTVRNASDLGAFARDLVAGRLPSRLPPRRVLIRLRVERSVVTDAADVVELGGSWPGLTAAVAPTGQPLTGDQDCVLALAAADGVVVAAGRCDSAMTTVTTPAAALELAAASGENVPAALVVDDYTAPGPAAKRGLVLRGRAQVTVDAGVATVRLDAERATTWDGAETETRPAS